MIFEKIDQIIRIASVGIICLFGSLAFIFWLIGLEHNLVLNQKSISYWALGLSIVLILLGVGFLALYPQKIETLFPYFYTKILIRIPVYGLAIAGIFIFFKQLFSIK